MALGDAEHPISFRFVPEHRGSHVHVTVWAGDRDAGRGNAGTLVFRTVEWVALRDLLGATERDERLAAILRESIPDDVKRNPRGLDYWSRFILAGAGVVHVDATPFDIEER